MNRKESELLKAEIVKIFDDSNGHGGSILVFGQIEEALSEQILDVPYIVGLLQAIYYSGKRAGEK